MIGPRAPNETLLVGRFGFSWKSWRFFRSLRALLWRSHEPVPLNPIRKKRLASFVVRLDESVGPGKGGGLLDHAGEKRLICADDLWVSVIN